MKKEMAKYNQRREQKQPKVEMTQRIEFINHNIKRVTIRFHMFDLLKALMENLQCHT